VLAPVACSSAPDDAGVCNVACCAVSCGAVCDDDVVSMTCACRCDAAICGVSCTIYDVDGRGARNGGDCDTHSVCSVLCNAGVEYARPPLIAVRIELDYALSM